MYSKIKFVAIENGMHMALPALDLDIIDEEDELEKQILIGLGIELDGKNYTIYDQTTEDAGGVLSLVYYVREMQDIRAVA